MNRIIVNTRCLLARTKGVQRYTRELLPRMNHLIQISPAWASSGINGHLWEQLVLPTRLHKDALLWSPANTGPLYIQRQIVSIHDLSTIEHPEWFNPQFARWYQFLLPRLAQRAQKIITMSLFTKNRKLALWDLPDEKIVVTPEGVDDRFHPGENATEAARALGIPPGPYLLALGSLEPRKNLARLLRAWEIIRHKLPGDIWLILAGAKGKNSIFKDAGIDSTSSRVRLTGYVPEEDLPALYCGATGFIYPSLYEGFGLPPLEAMACGIPVIASQAGSLPEVLGDNAIFIDPFQVESIASAIEQLTESSVLRAELAKKGIQRAAGFTWQACAEQTWTAILEAAEGN